VQRNQTANKLNYCKLRLTLSIGWPLIFRQCTILWYLLDNTKILCNV